MCRRPIILTSFVTIAAFALLAAGCGGGGGAPGVANLASPPAAGTTATTQSGSDAGGNVPKIGPSGHFQIGMKVDTADGPKFSACMRKHGLPNFPDPNGQGVIMIHSGEGIDPGSPAFQSARTACDKLLPNGGQPTPAQIAQQQQMLLKLSACMRAHGIKDFPDPSNGGLQIGVHPGSDLDPSNPTFQSAQKTCQKYAPFKGGAVRTGSG